MRIVVLGDFQYSKTEVHATELAMDDISSIKPDIVIPLGDYGPGGILGKPEGIEQTSTYIKSINNTNGIVCTIRPILGNHDLQCETGSNLLPHGTMSRKLEEVYALDNHHGVLEFEQFRLFFISVDPQLADSCYFVQECYLTDEHFNEIIKNLEKRPGVPALFFTHAPPIGSGLMTVPHVHVRATNAFLDQNHDPYRWYKLIEKYPEIVMWFSAHYHIGHLHPGSMSNRLGTNFFMCGVHSSVTRDGQRQTRVIDIEKDSVKIRTLDHIQRKLLENTDWEYNGNIIDLVSHKNKIITNNAINNTFYKNGFFINDFANEEDKDSLHIIGGNMQVIRERTAGKPVARIMTSFKTGSGSVIAAGLACSKNGRLFAATDNGYLWEIDTQYGEALGTLRLNEPPVKQFVITDNLVWQICENVITVSNLDDKFHFFREFKNKPSRLTYVMDESVECMWGKSKNSIFAICGGKLYEAKAEDGEIKLKEINIKSNGINEIYEIEEAAGILNTESNYNTELGCNLGLISNIQSGNIYNNKYKNTIHYEKMIIEFRNNKVLMLKDGKLLFSEFRENVSKDNFNDWKEIDVKDYKATAICKLTEDYGIDNVCIAFDCNDSDQVPLFQIWDFSEMGL